MADADGTGGATMSHIELIVTTSDGIPHGSRCDRKRCRRKATRRLTVRASDSRRAYIVLCPSHSSEDPDNPAWIDDVRMTAKPDDQWQVSDLVEANIGPDARAAIGPTPRLKHTWRQPRNR